MNLQFAFYLCLDIYRPLKSLKLVTLWSRMSGTSFKIYEQIRFLSMGKVLDFTLLLETFGVKNYLQNLNLGLTIGSRCTSFLNRMFHSMYVNVMLSKFK